MAYEKKEFGYCPCCHRETVFVSHSTWLRDNYQCIFCHSIPRQRAIMHILDTVVPGWQKKKVHESSPSNGFIKEQCKDYSCSYFFEDKKPGEVLYETPMGSDVSCQNENLEALSFDDETFDIFVTQDVFEHINRPLNAFQEIKRILKTGGVHVFTVPLCPFQKTQSRIKIGDDGAVIPVLPAIYHGNPISEKGSLVTYDWGSDIAEIIEDCSGMKTTVYQFPQTAENFYYGLEADFLEVLVSVKG